MRLCLCGQLSPWHTTFAAVDAFSDTCKTARGQELSQYILSLGPLPEESEHLGAVPAASAAQVAVAVVANGGRQRQVFSNVGALIIR